ncbi:hypothetical protein COOONC_20129 [Cooperia oncophora]
MPALVTRVNTAQAVTMKAMVANTPELRVITEKPQFHIEKFHSDEKHAKKYGSDSHASAAQEYSDGDHYSKGHEAYHDNHGAHKSHHGESRHGEDGHGFDKKGHYSGYVTPTSAFKAATKVAIMIMGRKGHDEEYSQYYHEPHHDTDSLEHEAHHGHGRHQDYGNGHHDHHPYYGYEYDSYY